MEQRNLAGSEAFHIANASVIVYVSVCSAELDFDRVQRAWRSVVRENAILRTRIRDQAGVPVLISDANPEPPARSVCATSLSEYLDHYAPSLDHTRELARLELLRDLDQPGSNAVAIVLHHAIVDGRAGLSLVERLWWCYTNDVDPADVVEGTDLPPSVETLLPEPRRAALDQQPVTGEAEEHRPGEATTADVRAVRADFVLDSPTTRALTQLAHDHELAPRSLLAGAVLVAHRALLDQPDQVVSMYTMSPIDLRPLLDPPVPPLGGTNVVSLTTACVPMTAHHTALQVAREIEQQLRDDLAHGHLYRRAVAITADMPSAQFPYVALVASLSDPSAITLPTTAPVTDMRAFGYARPAGPPVYNLSIFDDRLRVQLQTHTGNSDPTPTQLMTELHAVLTATVQPSRPLE
ncbi:phthiocerol/phthiodiolone dimycocerosyl transferase family protein [Nocardia brasiliensis]